MQENQETKPELNQQTTLLNARISSDMPVVPRPHKKYKVVVISLMGFVFLVAVGFIFFTFWSFKKADNKGVFNSRQVVNNVTLDQTKAVLSKKQVLNFDTLTNIMVTDQKNIPSELNNFILPQAQNILYKQGVFEDKKDGFIIQYQLNGQTQLSIFNNLFTIISTMPSEQKWKRLMTSRANSFGFLDLQSVALDVKITSEFIGTSNSSGADIKIIAKKQK